MTRENWQLRQDILRHVYNNGNNYLFKNSKTKILLSYCEMYKDDWMGCIDYETGDLDQFWELFDDIPIGKPVSIQSLLRENATVTKREYIFLSAITLDDKNTMVNSFDIKKVALENMVDCKEAYIKEKMEQFKVGADNIKIIIFDLHNYNFIIRYLSEYYRENVSDEIEEKCIKFIKDNAIKKI